ncbi:hypothetical protein HY024_02810 [Candidatus Curtissbacteria bacterium]|nr:hypothetical protein [Candidatus Curtissbacteria bacterium]
MSKLLLIDGNNLFHRAYHALPPLNSRDGQNGNAIFGFTNMLLKAVSEMKPDYVACAFDTAAPTFRHVAFEKYKAQRPPPPPDLYPQLPKVKKMLEAFGVRYFEKAGYEADDLLASIATKYLGAAEIIVILSGDRDVLQMVDPNVRVQMPGWNLNSVTLFGPEEVQEKYGIEPEQMVDYKSMVGDTSDNVPGIAGIGPKGAADLLQRFGNLEGIYAHLDEISQTTRNKLEAGREIALEAKKLVELDRTVDVGIEVADLEFKPQWESLRQELENLGFKSIISKLPTAQRVTSASIVSGETSISEGDDKEQLELI